MNALAVVDLAHSNAPARIDRACRNMGFFAVTGHDIPSDLRLDLIAAAAEFFALHTAHKHVVSMSHAGAAWRGWFPLEGELTSGIPDLKEGYYFGRELPPDARPMHGPNLWPAEPARLRPLVTEWMTAMERLGQHVLTLVADGLGLADDFFRATLTADPTPLFRIFRYPPQPTDRHERWGVAEHSDYGLLTLLAHDGTPGLEVKVGGRWIEAPSDPELIICNLGDMLDRLTAGRYRSTPHRVRNNAPHDRYSLPFFLDPGWNAVVEPIELEPGWRVPRDAHERWDRADLREVGGTYGEWLSAKVSNVFPEHAAQVLND